MIKRLIYIYISGERKRGGDGEIQKRERGVNRGKEGDGERKRESE